MAAEEVQTEWLAELLFEIKVERCPPCPDEPTNRYNVEVNVKPAYPAGAGVVEPSYFLHKIEVIFQRPDNPRMHELFVLRESPYKVAKFIDSNTRILQLGIYFKQGASPRTFRHLYLLNLDQLAARPIGPIGSDNDRINESASIGWTCPETSRSGRLLYRGRTQLIRGEVPRNEVLQRGVAVVARRGRRRPAEPAAHIAAGIRARARQRRRRHSDRDSGHEET